MFLTKRPNGFYYVVFPNGNKRSFISTKCRHKSEANQFLKQFDQSKFRESQITEISLSQFSKDYLEYSKKVHTERTVKSEGVPLRELFRLCGNVPLHCIGVREIEDFISTKLSEASAATVQSYFGILKSIFETARRWKHIKSNPFKEISKPKVPELQPAYFSKSGFQKLLTCITDGDFKEFVLFALFTGMRLNEIIQLRWNDVDFTRKTIFVGNSDHFTTKSKRNRIIPMNESLLLMMELKRKNFQCERIFGNEEKPYNSEFMSKKFKKHIREAGLPESLHFHSLRHTFASWLVEDGASLYEVQKLLGHSDQRTSMIYAHLQPERLHATVNKISFAY